MKNVFKAVPASDTVYWVGAIDWSVRDFHGYLTRRGTTYNAYLVLGSDTVALIDTVKESFAEEMLARIASVMDPGKIEYIVSNHSEPDHSGGLSKAIEAIRPEKVLASKMGVKALHAYFQLEEITEVADSESLSLGDRTLTFVETRMCHWPDSMVSYLSEEEMLFSQDAFGMHLASYERFADQLDPALLNEEAAKTQRWGGLSDDEALALITINPAIQLEVDHRIGSLEVGKDADLVVYDGEAAETQLWLMEGSEVTSSKLLPSPLDSWDFATADLRPPGSR